jgi:hypothetical protein
MPAMNGLFAWLAFAGLFCLSEASLAQPSVAKVVLPAQATFCAESSDVDANTISSPLAVATIIQTLDSLIVGQAELSKLGATGLPYATVRSSPVAVAAPASSASSPSPAPRWRVSLCAAVDTPPLPPPPLSRVSLVRRPALSTVATICATDDASMAVCRAAIAAAAGLPAAPDSDLQTTYVWGHIESVDNADVATAAVQSFSDTKRRVIDGHTERHSPPDAKIVLVLVPL